MANPSLTPAASNAVPLGHIRVWFMADANANLLDCYDFPHAEGMTFRDLRCMVSLRSGEPIFFCGLIDCDDMLWSLDSAVPSEAKVIFVKGGRSPEQPYGPYIDGRSLALWFFTEFSNALLCYGVSAALLYPVERILWRQLQVLRDEGSLPSLGDLLRRIARTEGLWSLVRSTLPLALSLSLNVLQGGLCSFLSHSPAHFCLRLSLNAVPQLAQCLFTYAALVPQCGPRNFVTEFIYTPSLPKLWSTLRAVKSAAPCSAVLEYLREKTRDIFIEENGPVRTSLRAKGYDSPKLINRIPHVLISALFIHPLGQCERWIVLNLPQKSPLIALSEVATSPYQFIFASLPQAAAVEFAGQVALVGANSARNWLANEHTVNLIRRHKMDDSEVLRRMTYEMLGCWAVAACVLSGAWYLFGQRSES